MICQHTVGYTKHEISPSFHVFRYCICKIFTIWCLMTPNDLWSRLKAIGFLYSMWYSNIPYDNCPSFPSWDIMFTRFSQFDHCWPPNDLWPSPQTIGFFYSMWCTYIPHMRSVQASMLEISCLQGFHNLTTVDPKWPLTSTTNNRLLLLNVMHLHTTYEICPSFHAWDIVFTRFSQFDPCWPLMTFDLHKKQ